MMQAHTYMHKARWSIFNQFLYFTGIGIIGTIAHYTTLITLVELADIEAVPASICGFVLGALVNYFLNYRFTFRSNKRHREAIIKFFIVALLGLGLNTFIMALATEFFSLHYLLAQLIATGLVCIWNFTANRMWTFEEGTHATRS